MYYVDASVDSTYSLTLSSPSNHQHSYLEIYLEFSFLLSNLLQDIVNHNCKELVKTVPFFINADPNFVSDVITKLNFEMFMPGDIIIKENTKGDRMFFIQEGKKPRVLKDKTHSTDV